MTTSKIITKTLLDNIKFEGLNDDYLVLDWGIKNIPSASDDLLLKECISTSLEEINHKIIKYEFYVLLFNIYHDYSTSKKVNDAILGKEKLNNWLKKEGIDFEGINEFLVGDSRSKSYGFFSLCPFRIFKVDNFVRIRKSLQPHLLLGIPDKIKNIEKFVKEIGEEFLNPEKGCPLCKLWGGVHFLQKMLNENAIVCNLEDDWEQAVFSFLTLSRGKVIKQLMV